ncbi:Uncharacterized protein Fot_01158 [Forsythia ovata]|uniref:Uncharacterized protein n=1 Tax=Forsythia ovata TaxID=205694 RepID=A0ABD1X397_9LAMI
MKSFEDEIMGSLSPTLDVVDLKSTSEESQPDLWYLLEASNDKLGLSHRMDNSSNDEYVALQFQSHFLERENAWSPIMRESKIGDQQQEENEVALLRRSRTCNNGHVNQSSDIANRHENESIVVNGQRIEELNGILENEAEAEAKDGLHSDYDKDEGVELHSGGEQLVERNPPDRADISPWEFIELQPNSKSDTSSAQATGNQSHPTDDIVVDGSPLPTADDHVHDREPDLFRCLSCFSFFIPIGNGFKLFRIFGENDAKENVHG